MTTRAGDKHDETPATLTGEPLKVTPSPPAAMRWLIAGLLALIPASALLTRMAGLEMHFDEAQYWEWSQRLDWSYYSKGPLVAWLIALSESLFGHGEWQTRLPAWTIHSLWLGLVYGLAHDIWRDHRAAVWAVIIALTTPVYFALGLVMTTDILMFFFWTAALWALLRAITHHDHRSWYAAGAAIGLGALCKLSIALLPLSLLPWLLLRHRWVFASVHLWGGCLLTLLLMSPLLYWNLQHDWVMFRHELHHVEGNGRALPVDFIIGQWLALSPVVAVVAIRALWRRPENDAQRLLLSSTALVFLFFLYKAMSAKVQLNWPAPAYIGLLILFAGQIRHLGQGWHRTLISGLLVSLLLLTIAFFPSLFGLGPDKDPFRITKAWRQTVTQIHARSPAIDFIFTHNYQLAAELAYYWPGQRLPVHILSLGQRRYNQHDLWPGIESENGHDGLYVATSAIQPALFTSAFDRCTTPQAIETRDRQGRMIRRLYISHCQNYHGDTVWPPPLGY